MCLECKGWSREQVLREHVQVIERVGWSLTAVEPTAAAPGFSYTCGLTRYEGHPEILISGLKESVAAGVLNALGEFVRGGRRFHAGDELRSSGRALGLLRFIPVGNPDDLLIAQEIYGSPFVEVPGLQAVWANARSCFPGQKGWCREHDGRQEMFGKMT